MSGDRPEKSVSGGCWRSFSFYRTGGKSVKEKLSCIFQGSGTNDDAVVCYLRYDEAMIYRVTFAKQQILSLRCRNKSPIA
jgi:hypothetical protein